MFERNYSSLLFQVETEEDLDRLEQQINSINLSQTTTSCIHGWNFDYSQYATTVVTEVRYFACAFYEAYTENEFPLLINTNWYE
ncbi:hypothetical protein C0J52_23054 [Blattella germanica]|nr:hypothetical protein C0J52_23054 [Blattella germanica]